MWLPLTCPQVGTWSAAQAYALTRNRTSGPLVLRLALNPVSHTSQGCVHIVFSSDFCLIVSGLKVFFHQSPWFCALTGIRNSSSRQGFILQPLQQRLKHNLIATSLQVDDNKKELIMLLSPYFTCWETGSAVGDTDTL